MSKSGSQYCEKGTGVRYDPKPGAQVTPTQAPEHSPNPATIGSQHPSGNGLNNPGPVHNHSGASRAPAGQRKPNESTGPGPVDKLRKLWAEKRFQPTKPPPTKINIKSGRGSCIVASKSTLANANINVESSSGENVIMGFNGPNEFDVLSGDGRIQKAAGGDYQHTPASQLHRRIDLGDHNHPNQQGRNASIAAQQSGNSNEQGYFYGQPRESFPTDSYNY